MKKILLATAFAALAVSPALAQQGPWSGWQSRAQYSAPSQTYMYAPEQGYAQGAYMGGSGVVVENGIVIGQDPDANVRLQLHREALINEGVTPPVQ